jgi:hypothetical protein
MRCGGPPSECDTKAASPHCPGSPPRRSPAEPGRPSTPGFTHYDDPPPDELADIEELRAADRFRFANVLKAWIDVDDAGQITGSGYDADSHGLAGSTTVRLALAAPCVRASCYCA